MFTMLDAAVFESSIFNSSNAVLDVEFVFILLDQIWGEELQSLCELLLLFNLVLSSKSSKFGYQKCNKFVRHSRM